MTSSRSRPTSGWISWTRNHDLAEIMYQLILVCRFLYIFYVFSSIKIVLFPPFFFLSVSFTCFVALGGASSKMFN